MVYTLDGTGSSGRLHHIAYWVDNREDVLRAADIYLDHGIPIEFAPGKHVIAQGFFLYVHEPGGNRIEVASGGYLIFDPDCELVRGAYDLHVHTGPDLLPRSASDLDLAYRCRERGLAGFVIKSHYMPSAPRAAIVRSLVPEVDVLGAVTLNSAIGGINTVAVEIGARAGARIIWMPTFDGVNEMLGHAVMLPGTKQPQWAHLQQELRD